MKTVAKILGIILAVVIVLALLGGAALFVLSRIELGRIVIRSGRFGFPFIGPLVMIWLVGALMVVVAILFVLWFVPRAEEQTFTDTPVVATPSPTVTTTPVRPTPFDIVKVRYAKGEITKEQFDQLKQELG